MNISEPFIRRPIMTTLVTVGIVLFGILGYRSLPISDLPNVDFPTIQVTANLAGATPETMASTVATPLEQQFSTIAGIDSITSTSSQGLTQITLQFNLERNLDGAAQDVQAAITQASKKLPDMDVPPYYKKTNPADQPILYIAISSEILPLAEVDEFAENTLAQTISMVNGVAQVQVFGAQKYAVRVQVDPDKLAIHQIGVDDVSNAVQRNNVNMPTGSLNGPFQTVAVQAPGQLYKASDFRPLIVAYRNGTPIRLQQLGNVIDSVENNKVASWYNNDRAIILAVQRQPGTNTIQVTNDIEKLLPKFRNDMPAAMKMNILYDRSLSIRASVHEVEMTLIIAGILVVLVIFLFLRNLPSTIIPGLALPISLIGTFAIMALLGFSLDNISLLALTLCVGFVIDDAIVMLENIMRHVEAGEGILEACLKGSAEIGFTIVSMSISLAAVFIPVLFMGGLIGRLFHEFGVTICVAILTSGLVSITLTPMLANLILQPAHHKQPTKFYLLMENIFDRALSLYKTSLEWVLARPKLTLISSFISLAIVTLLYIVVPKGFLPSEDNNMILAYTETSQDTSFEAMVRQQQAAVSVIKDSPYVEAFMSSVGASGASATGNTGRFFIRLKPRGERPPIDDIIQEFRTKLSNFPGIKIYVQNLPPLPVGGRPGKGTYQYTLQSINSSELYEWAPKLEEKLRALSELQDVSSDLQIKSPQLIINVDRDKAAAVGIDMFQVQNTLMNAIASQQISTIYTDTNQYQVILEVEPQFQLDPAALSHLYVRSSAGQLIPMTTIAAFAKETGPLTINHQNQTPAVTITFNLNPDVSLSKAVETIQKVERSLQLPSSITRSFQGTAQAFQQSMTGLGALLLIAIAVIYLVLGMLYESFIHPITILSGLPSAGIGALITLMIFGLDLDLYGFFGIIMLIGIVKKNAIMMIDFALEAQTKQNKLPAEAIHQACLIRFRPIMMTTMAALLGALPIAIAFGAGSETRRPLGMAVVGGLLVSQFITLYITPVIYLYLEALQARIQQWWRKKIEEFSQWAD